VFWENIKLIGGVAENWSNDMIYIKTLHSKKPGTEKTLIITQKQREAHWRWSSPQSFPLAQVEPKLE
jgi:hypothetical protein